MATSFKSSSGGDGIVEADIMIVGGNNVGEQLADTALGINNNTITPTYTNGQLTKVEEKNGTTVKASSTLSYNADGTVNTLTELIDGKTVVTTLNYVNGEFTSATKAVL